MPEAPDFKTKVNVLRRLGYSIQESKKALELHPNDLLVAAGHCAKAGSLVAVHGDRDKWLRRAAEGWAKDHILTEDLRVIHKSMKMEKSLPPPSLDH